MPIARRSVVDGLVHQCCRRMKLLVATADLGQEPLATTSWSRSPFAYERSAPVVATV